MDDPGVFYTDEIIPPADCPVCRTDCTYDVMLEFNRKGALTPKQYRQQRSRRILTARVDANKLYFKS
ncbi:MAG: hypothetical protein MJ192_03870 [Clostridia bacterium]|nr:hypothetical protein [Clostridia bacterium]